MTNDTQVMTLTEFLLARIMERRAEATFIQNAIANSPGSYASIGLGHPELAAGDCPDYLGEYDPARALAECEAKRQLVDLFDAQDEWGNAADADFARRTLALPYADHPDYREEWKP